jgi:hypothetical protein
LAFAGARRSAATVFYKVVPVGGSGDLLVGIAFLDLAGTMASFAALAMRNLTTFLAAILMVSPVAGFRPIPALRSTRTSRPIPGITKMPLFLDLFDGSLRQRG